MAEPSARPERRRNRRGEGAMLRDALIEAAMLVLERTGQESAVTIRAVTREAGVAPQSFYLHFRSLDELLFALYGGGYEQLELAVDTALERLIEPTASERLAAICHAYLNFAARNPGLYRVLMGSAGTLHSDWASGGLPGAHTYDALRGAVAAVQGRPDGDQDHVAHVLTSLLWAQLHGVASLVASRPTYPWPERDELVVGIVAGVAGGLRS